MLDLVGGTSEGRLGAAIPEDNFVEERYGCCLVQGCDVR